MKAKWCSGKQDGIHFCGGGGRGEVYNHDACDKEWLDSLHEKCFKYISLASTVGSLSICECTVGLYVRGH